MLLKHISVTFDIIYYISTSEQEIFEYLTTRSISIIEDIHLLTHPWYIYCQALYRVGYGTGFLPGKFYRAPTFS